MASIDSTKEHFTAPSRPLRTAFRGSWLGGSPDAACPSAASRSPGLSEASAVAAAAAASAVLRSETVIGTLTKTVPFVAVAAAAPPWRSLLAAAPGAAAGAAWTGPSRGDTTETVNGICGGRPAAAKAAAIADETRAARTEEALGLQKTGGPGTSSRIPAGQRELSRNQQFM